MTESTLNPQSWKRVRHLQLMYRMRFLYFLSPVIVAFIWLDQIFFHLHIHWAFFLPVVALSSIGSIGITIEKKLRRSICPNCGDRLFARVPPKHVAEEYFDLMSTHCGNCGVKIGAPSA